MTEARMSLDEDIEALDDLCERLSGFSEGISLEWLDGYMAALLAGPVRLSLEDWLPVVGEGAFERAFSDPLSVAEAKNVIQARWDVLADQLDPEALLDEPDVLRLAPLVMELTEEDKQQLLAEGQIEADQLEELEQTGVMWALGFLTAIEDFPENWPEPSLESEAGQMYADCVARIVVLTLDGDELADARKELHDGEELTRDEMLGDALYAAQDLRLYWLEHAPKPAPRRVEAQPGRNDLCSCGSGRKYKKCCGANAS